MNILDKIKGSRIYTYNETTDDPDIAGKPLQDTPIENITAENKRVLSTKEEKMRTVDVALLSRKTSIEIETMVSYILNKGKEIPVAICELLPSQKVEDLIQIHNELSKIIAPSSPETISYVRKPAESRKKRYIFSHIPLVRHFIVIAICAIISLVVSGLSAEVNTETLSKGILNNAGLPLLKNLIFLCSAAGIGTVFFLLSKLTKEVKDATLSRDDTTYYWAMLIMGMLSGLILSEIIVLSHSGLEEQSIEMNRLLFALIGGFSSEVVYGILQTIMGKIQRLISEK